ncbi:hypothetical protein GmHk_06G017305 [Glycine max]|nr:hypothetical protein GmHk_06G017305 [Glycine max]
MHPLLWFYYPDVASIPYFGFIEEIWELNYVKFDVCVFKCKWVDNNTGVQTDDVGFTLVDLKKLAYQNDPFIMTKQAKQVFYVQDPCDERLSVVLHRKTIGVNVEDDDSYIDTYVSALSTQMSPNFVGEEEADDVHANHNDHDEGELIKSSNTSIRAGNVDVYGFLEPQSIQRSGQSQFEFESYIKNWMQKSKRVVYLGAYLNSVIDKKEALSYFNDARPLELERLKAFHI